jgi:hypothetical protein
LGIYLLPFVTLPLGVGEDEAMRCADGGDPEGEEFNWVGFGEDDRLVGREMGEGLVVGFGDRLEEWLGCACEPLSMALSMILGMVLKIIPGSHGYEMMEDFYYR